MRPKPLIYLDSFYLSFASGSIRLRTENICQSSLALLGLSQGKEQSQASYLILANSSLNTFWARLINPVGLVGHLSTYLRAEFFFLGTSLFTLSNLYALLELY